MKCEMCSGEMAMPDRGRVPRFCGTRCRVASHRQEQKFFVPVQLREEARWILHKDKRPMSLGGWWLSINQESEWSTFDNARASEFGDGIGFVLNGDGVVCIDLDDCVADGVINQQAKDLIDSLPKTFVEFSPSGRGLHIWGYGHIGAGRRFERNGLKTEIYGEGRYLTVTGKAHVKAELARLDLQDLLG